jgi:polar amino acid transport system substrate-binding protein
VIPANAPIHRSRGGWTTLTTMLTRRRLLALAGTLPVAGTVACAEPMGNTLEQARRAGAIRVGIAGEQPYAYIDPSGRLTGAQPEVARAVLGELGVEALLAVRVPFDELIPGLRDDQFDIITAGMTVTPTRCAAVVFSRPDFIAPPAFLVREGNPREIETFDDVARSGIRLAVLNGAIEITYALEAGVERDQLQVVDTQNALFHSVDSGDVAAGALTAISLTDELRRNPGSGLEVTDPVRPEVDGRTVVPAGAFAMRIGDTELLTAFNAELAELQRSGRWLEITEPFGFSAANLPPPGLTTAELCAPEEE